MVTYVKCPIAFDVLAHYALTNLIGEPRFKITCFVGWIKYNSEKSSADLYWHNCGDSEEMSTCVGKNGLFEVGLLLKK